MKSQQPNVALLVALTVECRKAICQRLLTIVSSGMSITF